MVESGRLRRRRRGASSSSDEVEIKLTNIANNPDFDPRTRKRRGAQSTTEEPVQPTSTSPPETTSNHTTEPALPTPEITQPSSTNDIAQIRADLQESDRSTIDPEYWDESHNWDTGEIVSSGYWHFLGSFE